MDPFQNEFVSTLNSDYVIDEKVLRNLLDLKRNSLRLQILSISEESREKIKPSILKSPKKKYTQTLPKKSASFKTNLFIINEKDIEEITKITIKKPAVRRIILGILYQKWEKENGRNSFPAYEEGDGSFSRVLSELIPIMEEYNISFFEKVEPKLGVTSYDVTKIIELSEMFLLYRKAKENDELYEGLTDSGIVFRNHPAFFPLQSYRQLKNMYECTLASNFLFVNESVEQNQILFQYFQQLRGIFTAGGFLPADKAAFPSPRDVSLTEAKYLLQTVVHSTQERLNGLTVKSTKKIMYIPGLLQRSSENVKTAEELLRFTNDALIEIESLIERRRGLNAMNYLLTEYKSTTNSGPEIYEAIKRSKERMFLSGEITIDPISGKQSQTFTMPSMIIQYFLAASSLVGLELLNEKAILTIRLSQPFDLFVFGITFFDLQDEEFEIPVGSEFEKKTLETIRRRFITDKCKIISAFEDFPEAETYKNWCESHIKDLQKRYKEAGRGIKVRNSDKFKRQISQHEEKLFENEYGYFNRYNALLETASKAEQSEIRMKSESVIKFEAGIRSETVEKFKSFVDRQREHIPQIYNGLIDAVSTKIWLSEIDFNRILTANVALGQEFDLLDKKDINTNESLKILFAEINLATNEDEQESLRLEFNRQLGKMGMEIIPKFYFLKTPMYDDQYNDYLKDYEATNRSVTFSISE